MSLTLNDSHSRAQDAALTLELGGRAFCLQALEQLIWHEPLWWLRSVTALEIARRAS